MQYQTANLIKHLSYKVNILEALIKHVLLCRNLQRTTVYSLPEFPHLKNAPNDSAPRKSRTFNLRFRRALLYPVELSEHVIRPKL